MRLLSRSLYFWVATILVLILVLIAAVYVFPPIVSEVRTNQQTASGLEQQINDHEQFLVTLASLEKEKEKLDELHEKATLSLPSEAQPEILQLQFDGLLQSIGLKDVAISVPLNSGEGEGEEFVQFTLDGVMSFDKTKELIAQLRTLSRWNRITTISLTQGQGGVDTSVSLTGKAFFKGGKPKDFSGQSSFLTQAQDLFDNLEAYTTIPDVTTEGTFGKQNPFGN
jgi:hypothetical protein